MPDEWATVLLVSNVYGPCRYWTTETKRIRAFGRLLPRHGWRCLHLVKACHCAPDEVQDPVHDRLLPWSQRLVDFDPGTPLPADAAPVVVRVQCSPRLAVRAFLACCRWERHRWATAAAAAELFHLHFPFPSWVLPDAASGSGPGRVSVLTPLRRMLGLWARGHGAEQDRINWVSRGTGAGLKLASARRVEAVIGSFPSTQNLLVAAAVAQRLRLPWVADFRDSAVRGWCCPRADLPRIRHALRSAVAAVYVTGEEAERDRGLHRLPVSIVENGYDREPDARQQAARNPASDRFVLRYLGTTYPQRTLDCFLDGLRAFAGDHAQALGHVAFEYYGASYAEVGAAIAARALQGWARAIPPVPADEAALLTRSATALVMPTNDLGLSGVPGAGFYECLASLRPVLAAGTLDGYVESILARTRCGALCTTPAAVQALLEQWYGQWRSTGAIDVVPDVEQLSHFSREAGVRRLAELLNRVRGPRRDGGAP